MRKTEKLRNICVFTLFSELFCFCCCVFLLFLFFLFCSCSFCVRSAGAGLRNTEKPPRPCDQRPRQTREITTAKHNVCDGGGHPGCEVRATRKKKTTAKQKKQKKQKNTRKKQKKSENHVKTQHVLSCYVFLLCFSAFSVFSVLVLFFLCLVCGVRAQEPRKHPS